MCPKTLCFFYCKRQKLKHHLQRTCLNQGHPRNDLPEAGSTQAMKLRLGMTWAVAYADKCLITISQVEVRGTPFIAFVNYSDCSIGPHDPTGPGSTTTELGTGHMGMKT